MKVLIRATCPCGQEFETTEQRVAEGRGRYCSKSCFYAYRTRPSGLTYNIVARNQGWFQKGRYEPSGPDSPYWRGDNVSYSHLHDWVQKVKGPYPEKCENCGRRGYVEWANLSHEYHRDPADWAALCKPCHGKLDAGETRGAAVRTFGPRLASRIAL